MAEETARRLLIEDYLPIDAISGEARQEGSVTQARGHLSRALLSLLHRWWARRPLVACRAAVFGALTPAEQGANGGEGDGARFLEELCTWKVPRNLIDKAGERIRDAHGGTAPRVLDMFAGGGSFPLEAARLGCEAHALELNPVAHIVQLATLVYPGTYGQALVDEVERWSAWILVQARAELAADYQWPAPPADQSAQTPLAFQTGARQEAGTDTLAYLWTRTVPCPRPGCGATVPLVRQTWLRKKAGAFLAVRPRWNAGASELLFDLVASGEGDVEGAISEWRFDPSDLSSGGEADCLACHAPVPIAHVKGCGQSGKLLFSLMAAVGRRAGQRGRTYIPSSEPGLRTQLPSVELGQRIERLFEELGERRGDVLLPPRGALGFRVQPYGFTAWDELFTPRQIQSLLTFVKGIRSVHSQLIGLGADEAFARAVVTYLACILDRVAERNWTITHWDADGEFIQVDIGSGRLPMTWDFPEANPIGSGSGSWQQASGDVIDALKALVKERIPPVDARRGSALSLPYEDCFFDAILTDPPYYDNVPYSYLADFFYVWLRRAVGTLYPDHFAGSNSPVKAEAVMDPARHAGNSEKARQTYESMMAQAFAEANRVLKPDAPMVCVYAHKTTAGWATLVEALRKAGFVVTEAWPLDTENPSRQRSKGSAALSSSISLVARKRARPLRGSYERDVQPNLNATVTERVDRLWALGVSGADLVIACVGAGLSAFTQFTEVEYANGEMVQAEGFLNEVETVVLDTILGKLSAEVGEGQSSQLLAQVDRPTRFYVLWRYTYRSADLDAGEAIVFANGTHVELDGPAGLSSGPRPLVEKKKSQYRLFDYKARGQDTRLGLTQQEGQGAPAVDILHRLLWLLEHAPRETEQFLKEARPNLEQLRLVAQALAGPALKGGQLGEVSPTGELAALGKLTANWRGIVEDSVLSKAEREDRKTGQRRLGLS